MRNNFALLCFTNGRNTFKRSILIFIYLYLRNEKPSLKIHLHHFHEKICQYLSLMKIYRRMKIKIFLKKSILIQAQIVCWCKMKKKTSLNKWCTCINFRHETKIFLKKPFQLHLKCPIHCDSSLFIVYSSWSWFMIMVYGSWSWFIVHDHGLWSWFSMPLKHCHQV